MLKIGSAKFGKLFLNYPKFGVENSLVQNWTRLVKNEKQPLDKIVER